MLKEISISVQGFLLGLGVVSYIFFECTHLYLPSVEWERENALIYCILFYICVNIFVFVLFRGDDWQVAVRACFIGNFFGIGVIISALTPWSYKPFGFYLIILSFFHFSEYLLTAITNPSNLSLDSFLLNHSVSYWVAACCSWIEFFLERWLLTSYKEYWYVSVIGIVICILGEITRKLAMITANKNFNHIVQVSRQESHELVTWGIYRLFRHPSYVGWFWWSVGTQIVLLNPICFIGYAITSWYFFYVRVYFEEMMLIRFFGQKYVDYKKKVGTGLPFISGYYYKPVENPN
ncbi:UNVERIFIED_CONTAM: hypothetical protein RMT77_000594 [Armadillidium vulgare]